MADRLTAAWEYFIEQHGDQKYGKDLPYEYHLRKVYDEMIRVGVTDKDLLISAPGHDSIEDANTSVREIEFKFGWRVASLCWAVSDGPGKNRKERKVNAYAKIRFTPDAAVLKLADRVANMRAAVSSAEKRGNPRMMTMYLKEAQSFRDGLRNCVYSSDDHVKWAQQLLVNLSVLEERARAWLKDNT